MTLEKFEIPKIKNPDDVLGMFPEFLAIDYDSYYMKCF